MKAIITEGLNLVLGDARFTFYSIREQLLKPESTNFSQLHSHSFYEIHFVTGGTYTYSGTDKSIALSQGDFLVIPPIVPHYSAKVSKNYKSTVIQFSLSKCEGKSGFYRYFTSSLDSVAMKPVAASDALICAVAGYDDSAGHSSSLEALCKFKAVISDIIYRLFGDINGYRSESPQSYKTTEKNDFLITLDRMVADRNCSLSDIAETTGYSTRNIARLINSIYKASLSELRRKFALESAKKLLSSTGSSSSPLNMEEIAAEAGFRNAAAMRNAFKKYENATPNDFKTRKVNS